jgi:tryptophan synthase beta subunit
LRRDNELLKRELAACEGSANDTTLQSDKASELKNRLQELEEEHARLKKENSEFDETFKQKQREYDERRKKLVAAQAMCDPVAVNRQIKVVENRLDKV